jgi:hypothetical protein
MLTSTDTGGSPTDTGSIGNDVGVGSDAGPRVDAASSIDAYVVRTDAYVPPNDAYTPRPDAYVPPNDAYTPPSCTLTFSMTQFTTLSPGCFTRCQHATLTAYNACAPNDGTCQNNALNSDPTASIGFDINGNPAPMPLNCAQCFSLQELHCAFTNGCPTQTYNFAICDPTTTSCTSQTNAFNTCWTAHQTAIGTCINSATMGAIACFGP